MTLRQGGSSYYDFSGRNPTLKRVRPFLAILIALSLVFAPVASAVTAPHQGAMGNIGASAAIPAEMSGEMPADMVGMDDCTKMAGATAKHDCPCCDTSKACPPDLCLAKCFKVLCTLPSLGTMVTLTIAIERPDAAVEPPDWAWAPQPPPPRT